MPAAAVLYAANVVQPIGGKMLKDKEMDLTNFVAAAHVAEGAHNPRCFRIFHPSQGAATV